MKFKTGFAALVLAAAVGITGCSSSESGSPKTGDAGNSVAVDSSTKDAAVTDAATTEDEPSESDDHSDHPTSEEASEAEASAETSADEPSSAEESTPAAGGGDLDREQCLKLANLQKDFAEKIMQKVVSGSLTQADVDAVFTDEAKSSIPDDLKADYDEMHKLSNEMVGKQPGELIEPLQKLQKLLGGMVGKIRSACTGG